MAGCWKDELSPARDRAAVKRGGGMLHRKPGGSKAMRAVEFRSGARISGRDSPFRADAVPGIRILASGVPNSLRHRAASLLRDFVSYSIRSDNRTCRVEIVGVCSAFSFAAHATDHR